MKIRLKLDYIMENDNFPCIIETGYEHIDISVMDAETAQYLYDLLCMHMKYIKCDLGEYDE